MDLSKPGVFCFLDGLAGAQTGQFARKAEQLGYSALWFAETRGREPFSFASYLLGQTERLIVATGIAVVYAYEPITIANAARTLGDYSHSFVGRCSCNRRRNIYGLQERLGHGND